MTTKTFTKDEMTETYELPYGNDLVEVISNTINYSDRWCIYYELIFKLPDMEEGTAWRTNYRQGSTEYQDESPWEYDKEVVCELVHQVEKVVKVWETV